MVDLAILGPSRVGLADDFGGRREAFILSSGPVTVAANRRRLRQSCNTLISSSADEERKIRQMDVRSFLPLDTDQPPSTLVPFNGRCYEYSMLLF